MSLVRQKMVLSVGAWKKICWGEKATNAPSRDPSSGGWVKEAVSGWRDQVCWDKKVASGLVGAR